MTHDLIDRIVRQANPVPDMTVLESAPASVLELDRRTEVQTQVETEPETTKPRRNVVLAIAAIAVVVIGGLLFLRPLTNQTVVNQPDDPVITTPTSAPPPTTSQPQGAAPQELEGVWLRDEGNQGVTRLVLRGNSYSFPQAPEGGRISVDGDLIEFSNGTYCDFVGTYRWSIQGETLTFTPVEPDQCLPRQGMLIFGPFTR